MILAQISRGSAEVENNYSRVVREEGNRRAMDFICTHLEPADSEWRGLGMIPMSGMAIRKEFSGFDAATRFGRTIPAARDTGGCRCGDVLKGKISPPECPLFSSRCTPASPCGPCMVSSEGTCAAFFKYPGQN
jgi:hydrogenase expression/formation protein HypD